MDLFTHISSGADTGRSLARKTGASERGVRILCDFLTVIGHLSKRSNRYSLPFNSRLYLTTASPAYIGSAVRFLASDAHLRAFSQLTQAVKNGGASSSAQTVPDTSNWVAFANFMAASAGPVADAVAAALDWDPNRAIEVLDIAAGHGRYGLAVAARNPRAQIFALDAPEVLAIASRHAELAGAAERYHLIPGDAFQVDFGGPYDLIIVASFAHHFDRPTNTACFRKCRAALKPAGRLVLVDFVPNDDRVSPSLDAAFALTMLATTPNGDAYTFRELSGMLKNADFRHVRRLDMGDQPRWAIAASP
jgi:2-polyprenyl-3-methyl-5-hydroxy-6-metoxy-1,4-benzoquinol methylase